ncbi:hypothetical protein QOT17_002699 [Balamuthia mandrillaris]
MDSRVVTHPIWRYPSSYELAKCLSLRQMAPPRIPESSQPMVNQSKGVQEHNEAAPSTIFSANIGPDQVKHLFYYLA